MSRRHEPTVSRMTRQNGKTLLHRASQRTCSRSATRGLLWFRGPVNQKCGIGREVPTDHEAPGQENAATAARVRSRRRATCYSREKIGLNSHVASTAEQGQGVPTQWPGSPWKQGLTDVSGARGVAAPVPRTGQCRHEWTSEDKTARDGTPAKSGPTAGFKSNHCGKERTYSW